MSKELIAFALVAEEYERTGDPVKGLKPLFAPLLMDSKGTPFNAEVFSSAFTQTYGLQMTPFVASALAERMVELDLLTQSYDRNTGTTYLVSQFDWESDPIEETQVERTIAHFVEWASQRASEYRREFNAATLEDAMLSRLARPEFASIFAQPEGDKNSRLRRMMGVAGVGGASEDGEFFDYLVASFILHVQNNAPAVFDSIALVSYGALIADAVAGLAVPTESSSGEKQLRLVFDAPLILDLLDLNSPAHREYAAGLIDIAQRAGMMLAVFDHSMDEMRQTIQATLEASGRGEGYGPMAQRLRTEAGMRLRATLARDRLRERVTDFGFTILRAETYREARFLKWFPEDRLDQVRNAIGDLHEHLEARIRDAESVAAVARLKGDRYDAENIFDAGSVFITRNSVLCKRVNRALTQGRSKPSPTFSIATDGQIAGALWFVGGMQGVELSRRRLIANCSAAILPRRELISRISSTLDGIGPDLRHEFETLMADGRASLCVMRLTAGDIDLIDRDKSIELVEQMKAELSAPAVSRAEAAEAHASEVRRDAESRIQLIEGSLRERNSALEKVQVEKEEQAEKFDTEFAQLQLELDAAKRREGERDTQSQLDRQRREGRIAQLVAEFDSKRARFEKRLTIEAVVFVSIVTIASVSQDSPVYIRIIAAICSLATIGIILKIFNSWLKRFSAWYFRSDAAVIGELRGSLD